MLHALSRNTLSGAVLLSKSLKSSSSRHAEIKLYLVRVDKSILLNSFFDLLVNGLQALYVNLGRLKCISGVNVSPANKNLFIISFTKENLLKGFGL